MSNFDSIGTDERFRLPKCENYGFQQYLPRINRTEQQIRRTNKKRFITDLWCLSIPAKREFSACSYAYSGPITASQRTSCIDEYDNCGFWVVTERILLSRRQQQRLKAKFHYTRWFRAGSEQAPNQLRTSSEPVQSQLRTSLRNGIWLLSSEDSGRLVNEQPSTETTTTFSTRVLHRSTTTTTPQNSSE